MKKISKYRPEKVISPNKKSLKVKTLVPLRNGFSNPQRILNIIKL